MANRLRLLLSLLLLTVMIGVSIPSAAGAATPTPTGSTSFNPFWETALTNPLSMISGFGMSGFQKSRLAKAEPNECFKAIGDSIYPWNFKTQGPCPAGYQPKVNDAYVWGLAKSGNRVWWGTGPNIVCLVFSGYLQQTNPIQTDSYVCEIGKNKYGLGDFRPPHIFYYDLATKAQVEVTPPEAQRILGIRSAGSIGDLVLMGGPNLTGGVTFLAFRSSDGEFLGAKTTSYTNIRKWIVINNVLYTGVGTADGRGAILRWKGDVSNPLVDPEVVGVLKTEPAEFACHEGRLFTATWPGNNPTDSSSDRMAGLYMSPVIPAGGLTATHATGWSKITTRTTSSRRPTEVALWLPSAATSSGAPCTCRASRR